VRPTVTSASISHHLNREQQPTMSSVYWAPRIGDVKP